MPVAAGLNLQHLLALAAAVLAVAACLASTAAASQPRLDDVVETFVHIVERSEFGDRSVGLTRWNRPITIGVAGKPTADQSVALSAHVARLGQTTKRSLSLVPPIARPDRHDAIPGAIDITDPQGVFQLLYHLPASGWTNYLIQGRAEDIFVWRSDLLVIFADRATAAQIARILRVENVLLRAVTSGASPCFAFFHTDASTHEIKYGIVVLRTDVPEWTRRRCLHEELTQVLGLRNDVKGSEITLFDDMPSRRRTELTPFDWMFLELLYDERMKLGLAGTELRRVARELLAERLARRD